MRQLGRKIFYYEDYGVLYPAKPGEGRLFIMSYETLIAKLTPKLRRICAKAHIRYGYFGADDLYQEALVHLWQAFDAGQLADKTDSYILQGCYFHLKNYLRTHYDRARLVYWEQSPKDEGSEGECPAVLEIEDPLRMREVVHCDLLIERIRNNGLTVREKEVFNLALEGLTVREIGARMGVSHVRVVKLAKAMRRKCLGHMDVAPGMSPALPNE